MYSVRGSQVTPLGALDAGVFEFLIWSLTTEDMSKYSLSLLLCPDVPWALPSPCCAPAPLTRMTVNSRAWAEPSFCPPHPAQAAGHIQHQGRCAGNNPAGAHVRTGPPGFQLLCPGFLGQHLFSLHRIL